MPVIGKFYVSEILLSAGTKDATGKVVLAPVCRGAHNAQWATATPSGRIEMSIQNPPAFEFFRKRLGEEVKVTFDVFEPTLDPQTHAFVPHPEVDNPLFKSSYYVGVCAECGQKEEEHAF